MSDLHSPSAAHAPGRPQPPHPTAPPPPAHWLTEDEVPPALAVAKTLAAYLAEGLARYRALVCLADEAPAVAPMDRMMITIAPAGDRELHLALVMPGQDSLRLDLIDLGIYRLLGSGLPMEAGGLRLIPIPAFSRLRSAGPLLHKDVVYRIAPLDGPWPEGEAMGG